MVANQAFIGSSDGKPNVVMTPPVGVHPAVDAQRHGHGRPDHGRDEETCWNGRVTGASISLVGAAVAGATSVISSSRSRV